MRGSGSNLNFDCWPRMVASNWPNCAALNGTSNPVSITTCGYCEDGSVMDSGNCVKVCVANQFA